MPTFLNPLLLWGLALASIPIIIHLLFRRKYRRVEWAPMHYLKLSIQRNRRRIRLEQLILLLLRTAMVALLILLVARPVMHAQGLGAWLTGSSRSSQILLIDDSLSMGLRERGRSAFERAQELALGIIKNVGPKDRFTLVLGSQPKQPLLAEVEGADIDQVTQLINSCQASETFTPWEPTLAAIDQMLAGATYPIREVTIITDLRRAGWEKELTKIGDRWAGQQVRLRLFDVGTTDAPNNLTLASLKQVDRLALMGTPTHWEATVRNGGSAETGTLDATFTVDGKPTPVRVPPIAAGDEARVPLSATFQEAGLHHVSFSLPDDDLAADNQRWSAVRVLESVHLALVDGEPSSEPLGGEIDFLALALSLGVGEADAFKVEVATDSEWTAALDARPDLLVLANLTRLAPNEVERLTKLVESGMGLMIFPGDQIETDNYNQLLYAAGKGLLPAELDSIADEELSGLLVDSSGPTPLEALLQLNPAVLERVHIRKFFQVRGPAEDATDVRVLARWNNPSGSPAALEKAVGKGRVLLWTVTADKAWSDWPAAEPSYVMAMREAATAIARADATDRTLTAGEAVRREVAASHEISSPMVESPHADAPLPLRVDNKTSAAASATDAPQVMSVADTRRAGLYKLTWKETPSGPQSDLYATNPDVRESDLTRITPEELKNLWGQLKPEVISAAGDTDTTLAVRGQEIWRTLAFCLLGFVTVEACFATWTGRQR